MNKLTKMIVAASAMLPLATMATTVAYWPLAGENGVRTTDSTVFSNEGSGGTMDAIPVSIRAWYGTLQTAESHPDRPNWYTDYPIGTNAFPAALRTSRP